MDSHERQSYVDRAEQQSTSRRRLARTNLQQRVAPDLKNSQAKRLRVKQLGQSVRDYADHPVWASGLKMMTPTSPLPAEKVSRLSSAELTQLSHSIFGYDTAIVPNPKRPPQLETVCYLRFCGLCQTHPLCKPACLLARKLHAILGEVKAESCTLIELECFPEACTWTLFGYAP